MISVLIYSTPECPRCKLLSAKLHEWGYQVAERLMVEATTDEIADCRMDIGYWPLAAPLLQAGLCWYADVSLFPHGDTWLDEEKLKAILGQGT